MLEDGPGVEGYWPADVVGEYLKCFPGKPLMVATAEKGAGQFQSHMAANSHEGAVLHQGFVQGRGGVFRTSFAAQRLGERDGGKESG